MTAFATGLDVETSAAAGENAAENNAFFVPLVIAVAVTAYTAKQGDSDIVAGIDKILANEDTASKLFGELAQKGIENALVIAPESTQAALTVLALTGQLTDQAITYVDDATGNVVSGTWNNLSPETQQNIRRTGFVIEAAATVVTGAGAVNKLAKLPGVAKIEKAADGALSVKNATNTGTNGISFGRNTNQDYHVWRHIEDELGMNRKSVRDAIIADLPPTTKLSDGLNVGFVTVDGVSLQYNAFKLPDGTVNIGRIHEAN